MSESAQFRAQAALQGFLDEDRVADLDLACRIAANEAVDIAALLEWLQQYRCAPELRTHALRTLRAALRLPAIPGPVCRPQRN